MARRQEKSSYSRITYPTGCKELNEELGKEELLKRLKLLAKAFQEMAQDENNASEYKQLALYLSSEFFLEHSNKDVRLLVACCIADIFRVFAPEAPFTDQELVKEIFGFLTQQLKGLNDPESATFKRYFYLLENLATVKSFNFCLEFEDTQDVFLSLFKLFFSIISDKHNTKVIGHMLDILTPLIVEADSVSQDILDVILGCILEPYKTQNRPAYHLARDLIKRTADAIEPYIQTFFNNTLMLGKSSDSHLSDRIYDLISELNVIQSSILLSVLPQLEFKLKSGDETERIAVTRMLGKMFAAVDSDLATLHRALWMCFLGRFNDIAASVRRICVQISQELIVNHQELVRDVAEHLQQRQHDSDEEVRIDVVQSVVGAAKRALANVSGELLDCVKERTLDKKYKIRKEALVGLGQIYRKSCDTGNTDDIQRVAWVRNKVLHAYYHSSIDDKILVERILNTSLVPFSLDPSERMKRLYMLYANLDDHAIKALQEIFKTQLGMRNLVKSLLEPLQRGDTDEAVVTTKMVIICRNLPDPLKAQEQLKKFVKIVTEDTRIRAQLWKLISPDCECKKAEECVKDILRKLGNPVPQNTMYMTVKILLERTAPVLIDGLALTGLLNLIDNAVASKSACDEAAIIDVPNAVESGMKLLLLLSIVYPVSFQQGSVYESLMTFVQCDDDVVVEITLQIFKNVGLMLERTHPAIFSRFLPVLISLVKTGTAKQAKYAIRCIDSLCKSKDAVFKQLYDHLEQTIDLESPNLLTALVAIGHLSFLCPVLFAAATQHIVSKFVVKELLMQVRTSGRKSTAVWCSDHQISEETQAKLQGLKMIVRWLLGAKSSTGSTVNPTLRLLYSMILSEGDLTESKRVNKADMARLRLQAGCCMLRLAQEPVYAEAIKLEQFQTMALLACDEIVEVRTVFVQKLHKGLISLRLPLQYLSITCLAANDVDKGRRNVVRQMLMANISRRRDFLKQNSVTNAGKMFAILPDYVLPYAVHLLAHDPDLNDINDISALSNIRECLWFLLEPLITKNENYSFSFYKKMLEKIKQCKDAMCPDSEDANKKMYAVCDLALGLIMTKTSSLVLKDSPAEPLLPQKLFTAPDMSFVNTTVYLPKELHGGAKAKKPGGGPSVKKQSTLHDAKSPDSSISSNPSSPVSSTKSSPHLVPSKLRQKLAPNKLKSARDANKEGKLKSSAKLKRNEPVDDADLSLSPASSKQSFSSPSEASKSISRFEKVSSSKKATAGRKNPSESINEEASVIPSSHRKTIQGKITGFVHRSHLAGSSASIERQSSDSLDSSKNGVAARRRSASGGDTESSSNTGSKAVAKRKKEDSENDSSAPSSPQSKKSAAKASTKTTPLKVVESDRKSTKEVSKKRSATESPGGRDEPLLKRSRLKESGDLSSSAKSPVKGSRVSKSTKSSGSSNNSQRTTRLRGSGVLNGSPNETGGSQPRKTTKSSKTSILRRQSVTSATQRRVGAAAKAAKKYADFEIATPSPGKKR